MAKTPKDAKALMEDIKENTVPIPTKGMYTKYESMYNLAKHGFTPQQVVDLTKDDIAIKDGNVVVKGTALTFDEAKVFASYLHDNGSLCNPYLFYGTFGVQSLVKGIKRSVAVHLRTHHGLKLSDIGWVEAPKPMRTPMAIENFSDIQRIIDELQGKTVTTEEKA